MVVVVVSIVAGGIWLVVRVPRIPLVLATTQHDHVCV